MDVDKIYRYSNGFCEYLKVIHKELTLEKFLSNAKLEGGFGSTLFTRLYNSVMSEAENLEDLYARYYKQEYDSFRLFIGSKFAIPNKALDLLMNGMNESEHYTLIHYDTLNYGMNDVDELFYGEEYEEKFTKLFLLSL